MARTQEYTQAEIIEGLKASKGLIALTARKIGCSPKTIRNYIQRYEAVREVAELEADTIIDVGEARLVAIINDPSHKDHWNAVRFLLRTKGRTRGYGDNMDITSGGEAIDRRWVIVPASGDDDGVSDE